MRRRSVGRGHQGKRILMRRGYTREEDANEKRASVERGHKGKRISMVRGRRE